MHRAITAIIKRHFVVATVHECHADVPALLAERFKLVLHREMKPADAYVLELRDNRHKLEKGNDQGATTDNGRSHIVAN